MLDWFAERWNDLVDFLWQLLLSLFDILKELFYWLFESFLDLVIFILDGLGSLFDGLNVAQYITMLPPETIHMLSMIGLSEAMGMIIVSLTIRMFLQLIPFVRLGS